MLDNNEISLLDVDSTAAGFGRRAFLGASAAAVAATALPRVAEAGNLGLDGAPARYPSPVW